MKRPLKLRKHGIPKRNNHSNRTVSNHFAKLYSQAIVLIAVGSSILFAVFKLNASMQLDTVLVASQAIYNVIGGISNLLLGVKQLSQGLVQLVAFALLAILVFTAVLSIGSGVIKLMIKLLPKFSFFGSAAAILVRSIVPMMGISNNPPSRLKRSHSNEMRSGNPRSDSSLGNRLSIEDMAS